MALFRFKQKHDGEGKERPEHQSDIDISTTVTMGDRLAFRTCSAIDRIKNTQFFHVAHFNPDTGSYEKRRVDHPLTADEITILESYGIEGLKEAEEDKSLKIDNRFAKAAQNAGSVTGFKRIIADLLYNDDEANRGYKNIIPLPDILRAREKEILGTFYIRNYLIEEGYIATKPHYITGESDIIPLSELQNNAFDPRIATDIDPDEWGYAGQRVNDTIPPKPIFLKTPYEDITIGNQDTFFENAPIEPQKTEVETTLGRMQQRMFDLRRDEAEKQKKKEKKAARPTLSKSEQAWIFEALLTEALDSHQTIRGHYNKNKGVRGITKRWLGLLEEYHGHTLRLSDLADEHGPLGTLFYAVQGEHCPKYAFEALPVLMEHFEELGTPIPYHYFTQTKMDGFTLLDRIESADHVVLVGTIGLLGQIKEKAAPSTPAP